MKGGVNCTNNGKYALVTGASSGIGVHYAKQLSQIGYNVILVSNQEKEIMETALSIPNGTGIYKDLSKPESAGELFEYCNENGFIVDVLINNAGVFYFQDVADCSEKQIALMLNLHVYTLTMLCRLFGKNMRDRKCGYILNMSSISVHTPFCGISLYTATKSYIKTFTDALRLEMRETGVRVMSVCPGAIATDLYKLPKNLQQIGVRIGIIYKPDKLVKNVLKKLFKRSCAVYVPGLVNYLFKPVYSILPYGFKMFIRHKTEKFKGV